MCCGGARVLCSGPRAGGTGTWASEPHRPDRAEYLAAATRHTWSWPELPPLKLSVRPTEQTL